MSKIRDTSAQDQPVTRASGRRPLLWAVAVGALATVAVFAVPAVLRWSSVDQSYSLDRLRLATVQRGPFVRDVSVQGRIVAAVSPTLYNPAAGTVSLKVQAGDRVTEDQVLATIDSPELMNRARQEQASLDGLITELRRREIDARQQKLAQQKVVDNSQVALKAAEREMRRAESAYEKDAISAIDYEKARDDLERARLEAEHARAEAELLADALAFELETQGSAVERQRLLVEDLQRQVDRLALRSPVTGIVGNLLVSERAFVAANQPLLSVVDLTAFEVEVRIAESYADALALGMPAEVRLGSETHTAELSAISPEVSGNQVTGRLRFEGAPPEGLRQNQRVSARVLLEDKADALFVPRGPFYDSGAGRVAYVVSDGVAQRRSIVTGATSIEKIEILEGLDEGERIVLSSLDGFDDATKILLND